MKYVFIINPMAGKTDMSGKLIPEIEKLSKERGEESFQYEIVKTEYPGHGRELAVAYGKAFQDKEEVLRIFACGGDGTLNEVMNGAYGYSNIEIGCLPYGTGNDYVKNFGKASDFQDLNSQLDGTSIQVDVLETEERIAAEICTAGFDAKVGYSTRHYKKLPFCKGKMAYNLAVVQCLFHSIGTKLRITVDGKVFEDEYLMICLANGTTYGGGYECAPCANLQDGQVDVIIVKKVSRLLIAKIISKYADGTYQKDCEVIPELQKYITYLKGKHITIKGEKDFILNLDGECQIIPRLEVKVVEKGISFILPRGLKY